MTSNLEPIMEGVDTKERQESQRPQRLVGWLEFNGAFNTM